MNLIVKIKNILQLKLNKTINKYKMKILIYFHINIL